jgi:putative thiamine transport system ATP-binding protein
VAEHGLRLENVRIGLNGEPMIEVDAHIAPGEVLTVMGASGSGKSTLIGAIAGFVRPVFNVSGRILLDGRDVTHLPAERRQVGVLFQDPLLFPHLSVAENILYALPPGGGRPARRARAEGLLASVDLEGFGGRDTATLSGGQQARVALVRVLAAEPCALLLDEPFSRLDAALRDTVRHLVFSCVRERELPALLVTHDASDAAAAGGKVIELQRVG